MEADEAPAGFRRRSACSRPPAAAQQIADITRCSVRWMQQFRGACRRFLRGAVDRSSRANCHRFGRSGRRRSGLIRSSAAARRRPDRGAAAESRPGRNMGPDGCSPSARVRVLVHGYSVQQHLVPAEYRKCAGESATVCGMPEAAVCVELMFYLDVRLMFYSGGGLQSSIGLKARTEAYRGARRARAQSQDPSTSTFRATSWW